MVVGHARIVLGWDMCNGSVKTVSERAIVVTIVAVASVLGLERSQRLEAEITMVAVMGGGWSRFKEQLLQSTSLKTSMPDTPDGAVAQSVVAQGPLQIEKETCQQQHSDLKKFECKKKVEKLPLGLEEILVISSEPTTSAPAPTPASAPAPTPASAPSAPSTHVRDSSKSSGRISFKATVMKHLKVPLLFSNSNNTNNNSSDDQTKRSKHHRRQRSISLFMPSLLRAASTAA
ncbi:hypothetical protein BGX26_003439 [Mortierella sp. AD094]|nr:hypothetical protein BGX26_003439 [Mortierella sp. AD094]